LAARLSVLGAINGVSRTVLKCTLPGVPDIYQGTEFWDVSLVDPDNRRAVDYAARMTALSGARATDILKNWRSGHIKQHILARLLADRAVSPELYADGNYAPLIAEGDKAEHVLAFSRFRDGEALAVVVPRLVSPLIPEDGLVPPPNAWGSTALALPSGDWRHVVSGRKIAVGLAAESVGALLNDFPVAVLRKTTSESGNS